LDDFLSSLFELGIIVEIVLARKSEDW